MNADKDRKLLMLVRHGLAEPRRDDLSDEDRALTDEGHVQTRRRGTALARLIKRPDLIVTSPLIRAAETAVWLSKSWKNDVELIRAEYLRPGTDPEVAIGRLRALDAKRIMAVGHEPHLTAVMAALTGLPAGRMSLSKDGCYGIELFEDGGELKFLLDPRILDHAER